MKRLLLVLTFVFPFFVFSQTKAKQDSTKKAGTTSNEPHPVKDVKRFPEFPGGMTAMKAYVAQNLIKPKDAISGKVYARFTVEVTGKVSGPMIIKGLNKSCDKAVIDVINSFPEFKPALDKEDKPIICDLYLPVEF